MHEVGSYEAKTHLPELLREVEKGGTVVITRRGTPIARIVPVDPPGGTEVRALIARMKEVRRARPRLTRQEILDLRDEGRRD